jgi:hypothetical protein
VTLKYTTSHFNWKNRLPETLQDWPELHEVIDAWPGLPIDVQSKILDLVLDPE